MIIQLTRVLLLHVSQLISARAGSIYYVVLSSYRLMQIRLDLKGRRQPVYLLLVFVTRSVFGGKNGEIIRQESNPQSITSAKCCQDNLPPKQEVKR